MAFNTVFVLIYFSSYIVVIFAAPVAVVVVGVAERGPLELEPVECRAHRAVDVGAVQVDHPPVVGDRLRGLKKEVLQGGLFFLHACEMATKALRGTNLLLTC